MEVLTQVVDFITAIPVDTVWYLLGSIGLSAFLQKVKHWLTVENPKLLVTLTAFLSFAGAAVPAFLGWLQANPTVLGTHSAVIFTGMTLGYRFVVQPLSSFIGDFKEFKASKNTATAVVDGSTTQTVVEAPAPKPATPVFEG